MTATMQLQFTIVPMLREELPERADFVNELEALEPVGAGESLAEMAQWFDLPKKNVADYFARVVNADGSTGRIIALCGGEMEEETDAWAEIAVHPHYRRQGVGSAVYQTLLETVQGWGATALHIVANKSYTDLREFLERRGFALERYFWQMRLDPETTVPAVQLPVGYTLRTFVRGQDEETMLQVRNATFAEHYGSVPRTIEFIEHIVSQPHFDPNGLFFAYKGDEVAGFCYSGIDPAECERRGIGVGWIHTLGTMPAHRGVGLGRALLLTGVNYLRGQVPHVELGVEGKNDKALGLYTSVGFYQLNGQMNLLKQLSEHNC